MYEGLKDKLASTIAREHGVLASGGQMVDSVLLANETVDDTRKRGKKGLVLKIGVEKTYDHVD